MRMKTIRGIEFYTGSREEVLPDFTTKFPYIATSAELDRYEGRFVPWHWHQAIELFFMDMGGLEYHTPKGKYLFPEGTGGMVNSNVLHMTKPKGRRIVQKLHIFDVSFLAGERGSQIEEKYFLPVVMSPQIEILSFYPDNPQHKKILSLIRDAFRLPEQEFGYEVKLRERLTEIWISIFEDLYSALQEKRGYDKTDDKIKMMMIYIHEHYAERLSVSELAAAAFLSERECFRVFRDCLHITPAEYLKNYRLQMACRMLARGQESVTTIGQSCGLGSSSYFGKVFREYMGCTPLEYRREWQNDDRKRQI